MRAESGVRHLQLNFLDFCLLFDCRWAHYFQLHCPCASLRFRGCACEPASRPKPCEDPDMKWTCYYFLAGDKDHTQWIGFCTDLDIAVQGSDPEEAQEILRDAILAYVVTALELPSKEQVRFLRRRAPVNVRVELWLKHKWERLRLGLSSALMRALGNEPGQSRMLRSPVETAATTS